MLQLVGLGESDPLLDHRLLGRLAGDGIAHGARQHLGVHLPLDQIVLRSFLQGLIPHLLILEHSGGSLKGVKVGIPAEFWGEGLQSEVEAAVRAAIEQMEGHVRLHSSGKDQGTIFALTLPIAELSV